MSVRYKVLLVDDEPDALAAFKGVLEGEGFSVLTAGSAEQARLAAVDSQPDIVVSDVSMPGEDGRKLLTRLRADARTSGIPVILMSAAVKSEEDRAEGLELGADDYIVKPFSPRLFAATVRAVLRRYEAPEEAAAALKSSGLSLDVAARTVTAGGRPVELTRKEFDLLTTFLRKPGRVLSATFLLETVWGYDPAQYNDPRTVTVHVSSLRKKLGRKAGAKIVAVPGVGYRFDT